MLIFQIKKSRYFFIGDYTIARYPDVAEQVTLTFKVIMNPHYC